MRTPLQYLGLLDFLSFPPVHAFLVSSIKCISFGPRDDLVSRAWGKSCWILEFQETCKFQTGIYTPELANGLSSRASCFLLSLMVDILGESYKLTMMHLIEKYSIAKEISS